MKPYCKSKKNILLDKLFFAWLIGNIVLGLPFYATTFETRSYIEDGKRYAHITEQLPMQRWEILLPLPRFFHKVIFPLLSFFNNDI